MCHVSQPWSSTMVRLTSTTQCMDGREISGYSQGDLPRQEARSATNIYTLPACITDMSHDSKDNCVMSHEKHIIH